MPRTEVFDREVVLEKAKDVFWLKGYNGTSMQDLVDATGLNRSSIYNSFGSKMELYKGVLHHYQKESGELFCQASSKADGPLDNIRMIFLELLSGILQDTEGKGCLAINCTTEMANRDANLEHWVARNREGVVEHFRELIEAGQKADEINKNKDSEELAQYLVTAFQGLRVTGTSMKDKKKLLTIIDNTLSVLH